MLALKLMILADAGSAHTIRWVRSLASRGHQIMLFTLTPPATGEYAEGSGVTIIECGFESAVARGREGGIRKLTYLRAVPLLRSVMRRWRPDLVHAHYASSYGVLATLAGARPRVVSVWGMDVYSFPRRSMLHRWLLRAVLASADAVLSTSAVMREEVSKFVDRQVTVTPFGIDTELFCPAEKSEGASTLRVGTVKTLEAKYGIEYLLKAFAIAKRTGTHAESYRLVIVGGGSLRPRLEDLAEELGVSSYVEFVGPRPYREIHRWHQSFDIAVYPSIDSSESFGVAAVESQSCGVPVIVSRIGGLPEVVAENASGLIVPARDPQALGAAMLALLENPATRRTMGAFARRHVIDRYSIEACTDMMEEVYVDVVLGHGNRRSQEPKAGDTE